MISNELTYVMKNWIFDWSGTLVDDMALVLSATNHVMRVYGIDELDREGFRRRFRLPYREFYEECLPGVMLEEVEAHFREGFAIASDPVPVLPHAREFLEYINGQGARLFVLTSMCAVAFSEQIAALGLEGYFEKTYAGVLDKREVIGDILSSHGLDCAETVFVGDMTHDIETAHHGGVASIGVLTGYNHREVLLSAGPGVLVEDLAELKQRLEMAATWASIFNRSEVTA